MAKTRKARQGKDAPKIVVTTGPYIVHGGLPLLMDIVVNNTKDEIPEKWVKRECFPKKEGYALCRCGQSKNKPYCDFSHLESKFDGTETASRKKYRSQSVKIKGPALVLSDADAFCAGASFCERLGTVWNLTRHSDDPRAKKEAIKQACNCPSGRLVIHDKKTGNPYELRLKPSIGIIEHPEDDLSGPIWVKGKVPIVSVDGKEYEIRNRVTLCRCGYSTNKPFCDGTHISAGFNDGISTTGNAKKKTKLKRGKDK